jgi:hypothetical protein
MKRIAAIVTVVVGVALVVGAFIVSGGDGTTEVKSPSTSEAANLSKDAAQAITNAGAKVQSLVPTPNKSDNENEGKYEARKAFVSVAPATVRIGRTFKIEVRGFTPGSTVVVTIAATGYSPTAIEIKNIDKNGKGESKDIPAPAAAGRYSVVAVGPGNPGSPGKVASTTLRVVEKN